MEGYAMSKDITGEAEVELAKGQTTADVARKLGITEQTYYRWRKEYGGLRLDQARRLKRIVSLGVEFRWERCAEAPVSGSVLA